jgi:hypothetical protein
MRGTGSIFSFPRYCKLVLTCAICLFSISCKAAFIDRGVQIAFDSQVGDLVQNTTKAERVRQLTEALLHSGVKEEQIGIVSYAG